MQMVRYILTATKSVTKWRPLKTWVINIFIASIVIGTLHLEYTIPNKTIQVEIKKTIVAIQPTKPIIKITAVPTKTIVKIVTPIPTPKPTAVPTQIINYNFPECLHELGQSYGQSWNGDVEQGDDFNCPYHTLTKALWSGIVVAAERTCWNASCSSTSGGVVVINARVKNLGMESTYYLHLDEIFPNIQVGSRVTKGQSIGLTGGQIYGGNWPVSPGFSSGPHIEIGFNAYFICDYIVSCIGIHTNPYYYIESAIS